MKIINIVDTKYFKEYIKLCYLEWSSKKMSFNEYLEYKLNKINNENQIIFVLGLIDKNKLLGFISLFKTDGDERTDLTPWYATMYVKKEYRLNGYSKLLNNALLEKTKELGYSKVYLKSDLVNYYEKYGAKYFDKLKNDEKLYYIDLENNNYYKAYEKRYKDTYKNRCLWETTEPTKEIERTIEKYNINKKDSILDLGCGEGRDAIYLLNNNYNVLAVDYSKSAIAKCNELTNNKYINNFKQFDLFEDEITNKFNFIYSVAVIHMFVSEYHRKKFYDFIYNHLKDNGIALIIAMGDGIKEYQTDTSIAFKKEEKININTNKKIKVANTSCKVKSMDNMLKEIQNSNLKILDKSIISDVPSFSKCLCFVVKKDK